MRYECREEADPSQCNGTGDGQYHPLPLAVI